MPQSSQSCGLCDKGYTQSPSQAGPATCGYRRCTTPLPKPGQVKRQLHMLKLRHSTTKAQLHYSQAPASVWELHRAQVAHHLLLKSLRQLDLGGVAGDEEPCNHGQPNRPVKRITAWRPAAPQHRNAVPGPTWQQEERPAVIAGPVPVLGLQPGIEAHAVEGRLPRRAGRRQGAQQLVLRGDGSSARGAPPDPAPAARRPRTVSRPRQCASSAVCSRRSPAGSPSPSPSPPSPR